MQIALDWIEILLRWGHVIAGITWIGTSFYFNWLDLNARASVSRTAQRNGHGVLYEVHGGSFYYTEVYWPIADPSNTKIHAGAAQTTLITGLALLAALYWWGAGVYLIDPSVMDLAPWQAVAISAGSIAIAWPLYALVVKTFNKETHVFLAMAGLTIFAAWGYGQVFGARAAYLHVGAMLGVIMALSVYMVIIPNHIAMRTQLREGKPLDTSLGAKAKRVSMHNNYVTLPVVFAMVSLHFPLAYSHAYAWVILVLVMGAGVAVRHYRNRQHGAGTKETHWLILAGLALVSAIAITYIPQPTPQKTDVATLDPAAQQAYQIVERHCMSCHSAAPSHESFSTPPAGFKLDTLEQLITHKSKVLTVSVLSDYMPLGNQTQMTDEERQQLGAWLRNQGALKVRVEAIDN